MLQNVEQYDCCNLNFEHTSGIPLLYVGGLTVPLGFGRSEDIRYYQTYDYGYEQA